MRTAIAKKAFLAAGCLAWALLLGGCSRAAEGMERWEERDDDGCDSSSASPRTTAHTSTIAPAPLMALENTARGCSRAMTSASGSTMSGR